MTLGCCKTVKPLVMKHQMDGSRSSVCLSSFEFNHSAIHCYKAVKFTIEFCSFSGRGSLLSVSSSSSSSSLSPKAGITLDLIRDL